MIGDFVYALTPRDEQITQFEYVHEQVTQAGNAAQTFDYSVYTVPNDRLLVMTRCMISGLGAGANLLQGVVGFVRHLNSDHWFTGAHLTGSIATFYTHHEMKGPHVLLEPGAEIRARVTWSAGNAANVAVTNVFGYLIPRGNIAV